MATLLKKFKPQTIAIFLVIVFIIGYAYFRSENLIKGPDIEINEPLTGTILNNGAVVVKGKVERIATLFMNGRQVFTDETGHFKESLLLASGYNIIELVARDKFGRTTNETLELVLK